MQDEDKNNASGGISQNIKDIREALLGDEFNPEGGLIKRFDAHCKSFKEHVKQDAEYFKSIQDYQAKHKWSTGMIGMLLRLAGNGVILAIGWWLAYLSIKHGI
jgi:hypothetical protein